LIAFVNTSWFSIDAPPGLLAAGTAGRPAWRRYIGIDDELPGRKAVSVTEEQARAEQFAELFRAVYLTFHRRDRPRSELPGASRAVLEHLALAGPLTIGEAATHMRRAQSVISEIVTHLERDGLLERENDPGDRRRTLIWLTPGGHEALRRDRDVLGVELLARAMALLPPEQADALNDGMRALTECARAAGARPYRGERGENDDHDVKL
jgi:DNA-binding MarR family transcriptional regulator